MLPKKQPGVACMRCKRECPLEDARFDAAEDVEGQDFTCRTHTMESCLNRLQEEQEQLKVQVGLVGELKTERRQLKVPEGKLAQTESERVSRDAVPESSGVRHGASASSVPPRREDGGRPGPLSMRQWVDVTALVTERGLTLSWKEGKGRRHARAMQRQSA